jgi:hypothetical protein
MRLNRRFASGLAGRLASGAATLLGAAFAVLTEVLKLAREMLVIPAQLWLLFAEVAGGAILRVWRGVVIPIVRTAWALLLTLYYWSAHQVTPRRAVAGVALAAAAALVISQWLDYRSVRVGTGAYSGGVESVAPAPDVARDDAGEAHAWVMIPIAALGAGGVWLAMTGRRRGAWLTVAAGLGAIAITVGIDAPKGLDEGAAQIAYEGADAQLLEGFWAQIASGAALAGAGLLLLAYGRPERAAGRSARAPREPVREPRAAALETHARLDMGTEGWRA